MAFEVPLEADRVDDLNLFSTFVRAPVIGTLMWILGGDKAKEEDMQRTQQLHDSSTEQDDAPCTDRSSLKRVKVKHSSLKKVAPSLLGSEVSDVGEIRDGLDSMCFDDTEPMLEGSGSRFEPGRQKRELSWSDEIGKDLVVYCEKSSRFEPKPAAEPVRSAMSRSRSIRSDANRLENSTADGTVPLKGTSRVPNAGLMPTMPYRSHTVEPFSSASASGVESPQWGWYTNITPPTPEMYYSRPHRKQASTSDSSAMSTDTGHTESSSGTVPGAQPNPIFRGLQDRNRTAVVPMGWHPL